MILSSKPVTDSSDIKSHLQKIFHGTGALASVSDYLLPLKYQALIIVNHLIATSKCLANCANIESRRSCHFIQGGPKRMQWLRQVILMTSLTKYHWFLLSVCRKYSFSSKMTPRS